MDCGYSLEPPRRGGSNEYQQSMFWVEIWKKKSEFLSINFQFLVVKFSIYLNRRVFAMDALNLIDTIWLCSVIVALPGHFLYYSILFSQACLSNTGSNFRFTLSPSLFNSFSVWNNFRFTLSPSVFYSISVFRFISFSPYFGLKTGSCDNSNNWNKIMKLHLNAAFTESIQATSLLSWNEVLMSQSAIFQSCRDVTFQCVGFYRLETNNNLKSYLKFLAAWCLVRLLQSPIHLFHKTRGGSDHIRLSSNCIWNSLGTSTYRCYWELSL